MEPAGKWRAVGLLIVCEVLAMGLWFSISATIPTLRSRYGISDVQASLLTSSVAFGFVAGTLASAILGLADRLDPRRFFAASALVAAGANAAILVTGPTSLLVAPLRFLVGACMAGVYPVGMKMAATWATRDTGLLVGLLVGALTLGSASPHLIAAFGGLDWRVTISVASGLAAAGGMLAGFIRLGPGAGRTTSFRPRYALHAWTHRPLRLANLGYFGHMWELYAMWTWVGAFLAASFAVNPGGDAAGTPAKLATFATVAVGAVGCVAGGLVADRLGRTTLTMAAMGVSGTCAALVGFCFGGNPVLLVALCLLWGVAVVADSAQFSASVIELAEPELIGTMLTVQTCCGFLLTTISIHLIPPLEHLLTWRWVFVALAVGPFLGVWAMGRLRAQPEAATLANGNR